MTPSAACRGGPSAGRRSRATWSTSLELGPGRLAGGQPSLRGGRRRLRRPCWLQRRRAGRRSPSDAALAGAARDRGGRPRPRAGSEPVAPGSTEWWSDLDSRWRCARPTRCCPCWSARTRRRSTPPSPSSPIRPHFGARFGPTGRPSRRAHLRSRAPTGGVRRGPSSPTCCGWPPCVGAGRTTPRSWPAAWWPGRCRSGFAEYWDPDTGRRPGRRPPVVDRAGGHGGLKGAGSGALGEQGSDELLFGGWCRRAIGEVVHRSQRLVTHGDQFG